MIFIFFMPLQYLEDLKATCAQKASDFESRQTLRAEEIKAQKFRSQEKNKLESLKRLDELLQKSQFAEKPRRKTRPTRSSVRKRLDSKKRHGSVKKNRGKVEDY